MSKAVKQMEAGLQKIKTELKQHNKPQDRSDKFAEKMKVNEVAHKCQYGRQFVLPEKMKVKVTGKLSTQAQ